MCGKADIKGEDRKRTRDRGVALAASSTLNRMELRKADKAQTDRYQKIAADPQAMDRLLVDLFLEAYDTPPDEICLDIDATDDSVHGQ